MRFAISLHCCSWGVLAYSFRACRCWWNLVLVFAKWKLPVCNGSSRLDLFHRWRSSFKLQMVKMLGSVTGHLLRLEVLLGKGSASCQESEEPFVALLESLNHTCLGQFYFQLFLMSYSHPPPQPVWAVPMSALFLNLSFFFFPMGSFVFLGGSCLPCNHILCCKITLISS